MKCLYREKHKKRILSCFRYMASTKQPTDVATEEMLKDAVEKRFIGNMFLFGFKTNPFHRTNSQKARHSPVKLSSVLVHYGKAVEGCERKSIVAWQMLPAADCVDTLSVVMELNYMLNASSQSSGSSSADESSLLSSGFRLSQFDGVEGRDQVQYSGKHNSSSCMSATSVGLTTSVVSLPSKGHLTHGGQDYEIEQWHDGGDLWHATEGMHDEECKKSVICDLGRGVGKTTPLDVTVEQVVIDTSCEQVILGTDFDDTVDLAVIQKHTSDSCDSSTAGNLSNQTRGHHSSVTGLHTKNNFKHSVNMNKVLDSLVPQMDGTQGTSSNQQRVLNNLSDDVLVEEHCSPFAQTGNQFYGAHCTTSKDRDLSHRNSCHVQECVTDCDGEWGMDNSSLLICSEDLRLIDLYRVASSHVSPQSGDNVTRLCQDISPESLKKVQQENMSIGEKHVCPNLTKSQSVGDTRYNVAGATHELPSQCYDEMPESEDLDAFLRLLPTNASLNEHQLCDLAAAPGVNDSCASLKCVEDEKSDDVSTEGVSVKNTPCHALDDEADSSNIINPSQRCTTLTSRRIAFSAIEPDECLLTDSINCSSDLFDISCSSNGSTSPPAQLHGHVTCISTTQESAGRGSPSQEPQTFHSQSVKSNVSIIRCCLSARNVHFARRLSTVRTLENIDKQMISTPTPDTPRGRRRSCLKPVPQVANVPSLSSVTYEDSYDGSQELFSSSPDSVSPTKGVFTPIGVCASIRVCAPPCQFHQSTPKSPTQGMGPQLAVNMSTRPSVTKQVQECDNNISLSAVTRTRPHLEPINFDSPDLFSDSEPLCANSLEVERHCSKTKCDFRTAIDGHSGKRRVGSSGRTRVALGNLGNIDSTVVQGDHGTSGGQSNLYSQDLFSQSIEATDVSLCRKLF